MKNTIPAAPQQGSPVGRRRRCGDEVTPPRLQWLEYVERKGPSEWYRGAHYQSCIVCNILEWTRLHRDTNGAVVIGKRHTPLYELTNKGRAALKAYRTSAPAA